MRLSGLVEVAGEARITVDADSCRIAERSALRTT